jgi:AraC-like DNA-binding protein
MTVLAAASLSFGGSQNPLVGALPPEIAFDLPDEPELDVLSRMLMSELAVSRCGGGFIETRLSEIVVVHAIRRAIAIGTVNAGLMAGLADKDLHPCLVAMHDDPGHPWTIGGLSEIAGMSRSRFIRTFTQTVGQPPLAYLTQWRLTLGRVALAEGHTVKVAAGKVGFSSAAGFSRAFSRVFGHPPSTVASHDA